MTTRREFLKGAALFSGGAALMSFLPPVIQKALLIDPEPGSTFYDAEHVIFLMQENRSFDHIFGSLRGVRGFNDPRAIQLPNGNPVWLQTDSSGRTYAPFHLDTLASKVAWMGSLPHSWADQIDARNHGKYDRWLEVKRAKRKEYAEIPLTLGYCTREDFPFYYSLADAFTVCDQYFCSSLTGTHPNRHYWMTGNLREDPQDPQSKAHVWNVVDYYKPHLTWDTFPERLEENGISWKIYQNDLTMGAAFSLPDESWLGNFGTNTMEYFKQYHVRLEAGRLAYQKQKHKNILEYISSLESKTDEDSLQKLKAAKKVLSQLESDLKEYTAEKFNELSDHEKELSRRAFVTNAKNPHYRDMEQLTYMHQGEERTLSLPKEDLLMEFRRDVENGTLPTFSWLSAPANFSDHPGLPWFGPWYVSEVMEILLKDPEVWKKTIIILTYDENDGFYDHVPPFVVPNPSAAESGKTSQGIDPKLDFVKIDQQTNPSHVEELLREGPVGLGYRVPAVVVSPWTRGGYVCSEIFDHTSALQFAEKFISHKTGKNIREKNITEWRRTICGDLTSVFRQYQPTNPKQPSFIIKEPFMEKVNDAQFKEVPRGYRLLNAEEIAVIKDDIAQSSLMPHQEKGIRPSCALPYELYLDGYYDEKSQSYSLKFAAGNSVFGKDAAGAPFYVYAMNPYREEVGSCRNYAVAAGDSLVDEWEIAAFQQAKYHLRAYGPNGFFREFRGNAHRPPVALRVQYEKEEGTKILTGNLVVLLENEGSSAVDLKLTDLSYGKGDYNVKLLAGEVKQLLLKLSGSYGWYDFNITANRYSGFEERFAGRVETGKESKSDPVMGKVL